MIYIWPPNTRGFKINIGIRIPEGSYKDASLLEFALISFHRHDIQI